jgi:hypothetical protein
MNLTTIIKLVELRTNVGDNGKSKLKYYIEMLVNQVVTIKRKLIEIIINLSETTCEWTPQVHISTSPIQ